MIRKALLTAIALSVLAFAPLAHAQTAAQGTRDIATNQITVAATATLIATQRPARNSITITNVGTTAVYIGNSSGVTVLNGHLLPGVAGATITIPSGSAIYGIASSGTQAVTFLEAY